jgi:hypothetical protein
VTPLASAARRASPILGSLLAACSRSGPAPAPADVVLVPQIDGDWWTLVGNPDLGEAGTPAQEQVDFAVWQAKDGSWQLWECIRNTLSGGPGGHGRLFYRWQASALTVAGWQPLGVAMEADPSVGELPGGLQAPHVVRVGDTWHMTYGDWTAIAHATSADGKAFTRVVVDGGTGMFGEPPLDGTTAATTNTRDPMVLPMDGGYRIYYSALPDGQDDGVYTRWSTDLQRWGPSTLAAVGGQAGQGHASAECPFVVFHAPSGYFYLFRTQQYDPGAQKTSVYRSKDPTSFGVDDDRYFVGTLPVAAPEIVVDGDQVYVAALANDPAVGLHAVRMAKLKFAPPP